MGYVGADLFPEDVTLPTDAPPLSAAILNVPNEANLDRTRWLFRREAMRGVCFDAMTDHLAAGMGRNGRPSYSQRRRRWYFGTPHLTFTESYLSDERYSSPFSVGAPYHTAWINDATNPRYGNGIFVRSLLTNLVYEYNHAADTTPAAAALPSAGWAGVIHEPVSDNWVAWDVGKLYTSPTAAIAWTDRGGAALPGGGVMGVIPIASNGAGLLMAHGKIKGVYTSSDGGVTWAECTTAFGLVTITSIAWDAWRGRFVVVLSDVAGLAETWVSLDGGSWSMLATGITFSQPAAPAPVNYIFEVRSVGPLLVGTYLAAVGVPIRLVYSCDGGATWGPAPAPFWGQTDALVYLETNGSDVLAVNGGTLYRGYSFARGLAPLRGL